MATSTSSEQLVNQLNIFAKQPVLLSVLNSFSEEYATKSTLDGATNSLQFTIPASPSSYTSLSETLLYIRLKIVKADGTNIAADAQVGFCNNILGTIIKNVDHYINDVRVSSSWDNYSLISFLEHFNSSSDAKVILEASGYVEDTLTSPGSMNSTNTTVAGLNKGLVKRAKGFADSAEVEPRLTLPLPTLFQT